jgi:SnoaL-like domain
MSAMNIEDRLEVQDLLTRYALIIDMGGSEADFLRLFSDDAVMSSPLSGVHRGLEGLRAFYRRHQEKWAKRRLRHCITNVLVTGAGTEAEIFAYFSEYETVFSDVPEKQQATQFLFTGTYKCHAKKYGDGWRLTSRDVQADHLIGKSVARRDHAT